MTDKNFQEQASEFLQSMPGRVRAINAYAQAAADGKIEESTASAFADAIDLPMLIFDRRVPERQPDGTVIMRDPKTGGTHTAHQPGPPFRPEA